MSKLLVKPTAPDAEGRIHSVTPASAGWDHVGFEVYKLSNGQSLSKETGDREICIVLLAGKVAASAGGTEFGTIGGRNSPFEPAPGRFMCRPEPPGASRLKAAAKWRSAQPRASRVSNHASSRPGMSAA